MKTDVIRELELQKIKGTTADYIISKMEDVSNEAEVVDQAEPKDREIRSSQKHVGKEPAERDLSVISGGTAAPAPKPLLVIHPAYHVAELSERA